jgi:glycosyltransferase involved in cell wall biosynthesis
VRVVVCTIVHHPADARIYHRQIRALLAAGHEVRYIAPVGLQDFESERAGFSLQFTAVPRAAGRRRAGAILAARSALAQHAAGADLMLIHDPELLLALPSRRRRPPVIWDVHEDTAAALSTKPWLPRPLRPPAAVAVHTAERMAERYVHLILAEHGYVTRFGRPHPVVPNTTYVPDVPAPPDDGRRVVYVGHLSPDRGTAERMAERYVHLILAEHGYVTRFGRPHPVVPNTTYVPDVPAPPDDGRRVVYVGHLSPDRGTAEMIELARLLRPHGVTVELIGPADGRARAQIEPAQAAGLLRWHGFVPNDQAMPMLDGALAGLSLLHDEPNFRHSMPTKVVEYMARGVPVVTTPLPAAAELARGHECGFVVPFGDPAAAADAVLELDRDFPLRAKMGRRGHEAAYSSLGWPSDAREFVAQLESWAKGNGMHPTL